MTPTGLAGWLLVFVGFLVVGGWRLVFGGPIFQNDIAVSYFMILMVGLVAMVLMFAAIWLLQRKIGNAGIVDVFWGATVAVVGVFYGLTVDGDPWRRGLVSAMIVIWATRLSWHLGVRYRGHAEDKRYAELKQQWGDQAQLRMFRFYQMQALGAFLFSIAVFLAAKNQSAFSWSDAAGVLVWLMAIVGEAMADYQLGQFKKDPKNQGEVCQSGWWRYSRHPNYFFEWLHWCCYVFVAFATSYWWLALLMPFAMYVFLTKVTGIPLAEKQSIQSRGDKYRRYQETTNAFFPWFPQQEA